MYSVLSYGQMAADAVRIEAYARAIAKAVRPGDVVVDLGCGTGVLALLALRAGARRVHAIDTNDAVWLARDLAAENGYADRLVVHHDTSLRVQLDEKADVIIADLRGSVPFCGENVAAMEDARRRWLAPGGLIVPVRDRLFVALIEMEEHWRILELGWAGFERQGFAAAAARTATLNQVYTDEHALIAESQLLSDTKVWSEITYGAAFASSFSGTVDLSMTRPGTARGLAVWFDTVLHDDIGFTTAPGRKHVYKRIVLPLLEPVHVGVDDVARVTLRSDVSGAEWAWETQIAAGARVRQATFLGTPTSAESLLRQSLTATPMRSAAGDLASEILAQLDGTRTLQEVTDTIASSHPELRRESVAREVRSCVQRYAR